MLALKLILAVVLGLVLGIVVNMGLVMVGGHVVAPSPGADMTTAEGIRAALPLLEPRHFLFPFLAHALGTLAGAAIAATVATQRKLLVALIVGAFFFVGGIVAAYLIPAPTWFIAIDLTFAYFPFAWLGYRLARRRQ